MGIDVEDESQQGGVAYTIGTWDGANNEWIINGAWTGSTNSTDILYLSFQLGVESMPEGVLTITVPTYTGANPAVVKVPVPYLDANVYGYIDMAVRADGTIQSWRGGMMKAHKDVSDITYNGDGTLNVITFSDGTTLTFGYSGGRKVTGVYG